MACSLSMVELTVVEDQVMGIFRSVAMLIERQ